MTINCSNLNFGLDCYVPSSLSEQNKLKSGKLVRELIDITFDRFKTYKLYL